MRQRLKNNLHLTHTAKFEKSSFAVLGMLVSFLLVITCYSAQAQAETKKIVKWKDANGVTHYGDKMPAQDAGRGNSVLSNKGTVIKTNESFNPNVNKQEVEKLSAEQLRQDSALLASYSSAEEIDLALARNLKSDQLALQTMRQRVGELQGKVKSTNTMFAGKKLPAEVASNQEALQSQALKLQTDIAATELSIAQTKVRYGAYKKRYLELRPREKSLANIKASKKTLSELEEWKVDAKSRLAYYLEKDLYYRRAGSETPVFVKEGIKQANDEIARAEEEIAVAKNNLKKSEQSFSN